MRHRMPSCQSVTRNPIIPEETGKYRAPPGAWERPLASSATLPAAACAFHMVNAFISLTFTDFMKDNTP